MSKAFNRLIEQCVSSSVLKYCHSLIACLCPVFFVNLHETRRKEDTRARDKCKMLSVKCCIHVQLRCLCHSSVFICIHLYSCVFICLLPVKYCKLVSPAVKGNLYQCATLNIAFNCTVNQFILFFSLSRLSQNCSKRMEHSCPTASVIINLTAILLPIIMAVQ